MGAAPALHTETPHGRQTRVDPPQRGRGRLTAPARATTRRSSLIQVEFAIEAPESVVLNTDSLRRNEMLKQLAAIGISAALVFAPVATFAQTASPTPTPTSTATPMMKKVVHHKVVKAKHVVKKPMVKKPMVKKPMAKKPMVKKPMAKKPMVKKPLPTPTPTPTKS
jgi:hypothetical protein